MDGEHSRLSMFAKYLCGGIATGSLLVSGCTVLEPALLEGRWSVTDIAITHTSTRAHPASIIATTLVQGTTIEFCQGQVLIPLGKQDTLRFSYILRGSTLVLRSSLDQTLLEWRVVKLDHSSLQLSTGYVAIGFHRM